MRVQEVRIALTSVLVTTVLTFNCLGSFADLPQIVFDPTKPPIEVDVRGQGETIPKIVRIGPISEATYDSLAAMGAFDVNNPLFQKQFRLLRLILAVNPQDGKLVTDPVMISRAVILYATYHDSFDHFDESLLDDDIFKVKWFLGLNWIENNLLQIEKILVRALIALEASPAFALSHTISAIGPEALSIANHMVIEEIAKAAVGKVYTDASLAIAGVNVPVPPRERLRQEYVNFMLEMQSQAEHVKQLYQSYKSGGLVLSLSDREAVKAYFVKGTICRTQAHADYRIFLFPDLFHLTDTANWAGALEDLSRYLEETVLDAAVKQVLSGTIKELLGPLTTGQMGGLLKEVVGLQVGPIYKFVKADFSFAAILCSFIGDQMSDQRPTLFWQAVDSAATAWHESEEQSVDTEIRFIEHVAVRVSAPLPIKTLAANQGGARGQVTLSWAVPQSIADVLGVYQVFYSELPIPDEPDRDISYVWLNATKAYGQTENITISALNPNTTYYFRVEARDRSGNSSPLSNEVSARPQSAGSGTHFFFDWRVSPAYGTATTSRYVFSVWLHNSLNQTFPVSVKLVLNGQEIEMPAVAGTLASDGEGWKRQYEVAVNRTYPSNSQIPYWFKVTVGQMTIDTSQPPYTGCQLSVDTVLAYGHVEPPSAPNAQMFTFTTTYRHTDGLKPRSVQLYLKGGNQFYAYNMDFVDGNQVTGFRYAATKYCGAESNQFYFVVTAADGTTYRGPATGAYNGPTVAVVHDLAVVNVQLSTERPIGGKPMTITFDVRNVGSFPELTAPCRATVQTSTGTAALGPDRNAAPLGTGSGIGPFTYGYTPPVQDTTSAITLRAVVDPVSGETITANNIWSKDLLIAPPPGAIEGSVVNDLGAYTSGVIVHVVSRVTEIGSCESDAYGYYKIDGLAPAMYSVRADATGYRPTTVNGVVVHAAQSTEQNFVLGNIVDIQCTAHSSERSYSVWPLSWAPQGDRIAFTVGGFPGGYSRLGWTDPSGSGSTVDDFLPPGLQEIMSAPVYAPNGLELAFRAAAVGGGNSGYGIYISDRNGNNPSLVIPGTEVYTPFWSPDSQYLGYVSGGNIMIATRSSGWTDRRILVPSCGQGAEKIGWSPDGHMLASPNFNNGVCSIFRVDPSNSSSTLLTIFAGDSPSWLPNSKGIVYSGGAHLGICLRYLGESDFIRLTYDTMDYSNPALSADGSTLAYASSKLRPNYAKYYEIYVREFSVPTLYFKNAGVAASPVTPNGDGQNDITTITTSVNSDCLVTAKILIGAEYS
jgi:hypothetical protein